MEFGQFGQRLGGRQLPSEAGGRSELAPFVLPAPEGPEVRLFPELLEGACVGALVAALRPDLAEMPRIVLRAEGALDRGGKALGISRELEVGDPEFDAAVYVESEAPESVVASVLASPVVRKNALALVRGPAQEVQIGEGRVTIRFGAERLEEGALSAITQAIAELRALAGAVAVPKDMPTRAEIVRRRSVGHIFGLAGAWLVTLALALVLQPPPVLTWGAIFAALGIGFGLWIVVCVGLALVLRGAADSLRWFLLSAGLFAATTPFVGMKVALLANARLDSGEEERGRFPAMVIDRSATRIVVSVAGIVEGEVVLAIPIGMVEGSVPAGATSLEIVTRQGALGWRWVVGVRA